MAHSCCEATHSDSSQEFPHTSNGSGDHNPHVVEVEPSQADSRNADCCEDDKCNCDDACLEKLAQAMCADDAAHLHDHKGDNVDVDTLSACSTCSPDTAAVSPAAKPCTHIGLRKRKTRSSDATCGQHRSFARSRYQQTLSAFGCICRAMLSYGLHPGKARSVRSRTSRKSFISVKTVHSCCKGGGGCCNDAASLSKDLAPSIDSSCKGGGCCGGGGGGSCASSIKSARRSAPSSRGCQSSCCGGDASKHVAVYNIAADLGALEKGGGVLTNKLIRSLKVAPTVCNIKTSFVLCRAEFDYDSGITTLQALIQMLEQRSGFSIKPVNVGKMRELRLSVVDPAKLDDLLALSLPKGVESTSRSDKVIVIISYDPHLIGAREVLAAYASFSPTLAPEPRDPVMTAGLHHIHTLFLRFALSTCLTIPVLILAWAPLPAHPHAYAIASLVLATLVQVLITGPIYRGALTSLLVARAVETDLLVVLSTSAAYVYSVVACGFELAGRPLEGGTSFFETSTLLVTLIMLGQLRAMEAISIRTLQQEVAQLVHPGTEQEEEEVDARLLQYGDTFKVAPDAMVITDGVVCAGQSEVDESMMTGESRPVPKVVGSGVVAGTVNGPSALLVRVTRLPGENTISEIAEMVDDARFSRAKVQALVDRVVGWFVPAIVAAAIITFVIWVAVGLAVRGRSGGSAAASALTYAIAVLAVSCPCAIGLAVPMVILIAGGVAAKQGLVFKAATILEVARTVDHVIFDKTGTLTQGKLSVVASEVWPVEEFDVNATIIALIKDSRHPVARAVAEHLKARRDDPVKVTKLDKVEMVTGKGIQGTIAGSLIRGGNPAWLEVNDHPSVKPLLENGLTLFCLTHNGRLLAAFGLEDALRPEAPHVLAALRARNITVSILSGDHRAAVDKISAALGIAPTNALAGCLPRTSRYGTNDAVALARADVGVHLHTGEGAGFAASAAADVVLLRPDLRGVLALLQLSDAVAHRVALNFGWAAVYNVVAILFAAGAFVDVRLPPAYAGLGEIVSVLPVVLVALQLKWFKPNINV
ncbi:heavy metal translocatin [Fomitopsis betulina]|nr:heavy metal translocatin [Fomitopsis betulina]